MLRRKRLIPEIPMHAVDARLRRIAKVVARHRPDNVAGGIADAQRDVGLRHVALEEVADGRAERRVLAAKHGAAQQQRSRHATHDADHVEGE